MELNKGSLWLTKMIGGMDYEKDNVNPLRVRVFFLCLFSLFIFTVTSLPFTYRLIGFLLLPSMTVLLEYRVFLGNLFFSVLFSPIHAYTYVEKKYCGYINRNI